MTIKELKEKISDLPDDGEVLIEADTEEGPRYHPALCLYLDDGVELYADLERPLDS